MAFLHNILTVSHYEAKTLRRSWFFRLFSIVALFFLTIINISMFSPVGGDSWELISIPSSVPLINLYLLNIGQAIVVIFLASDFLKKDKKLDTNEVLYTRSMSNFEYVSGKTWGILRLFLSLNLVVLLIGLTVNIINKSMKVDLMSYLEYILLISVPTIVYSLGLAFMLMLLIRNQAVTFFILLGYAALNMFYLWHRAGSVFDFMAFGLPLFKSGLIGFENPAAIIFQRLIYFFAGTALIMATILMFRRLPQSRLQRSVAFVLMVMSVAGFGYSLFYTVENYTKSAALKRQVIETNRQYEKSNFPSVIKSDIDLIHKGSIIEATAGMIIKNDNDVQINEYLFSLNPGLEVKSVQKNAKPVAFTTSGHIVKVSPDKPLLPGESDTIEISWSGKIIESFCYPDYSDNIKEYRYRIQMVNVRKRQAFLDKDYVLLTPEAHWYPVAGLNYYPSNPGRIKIDFTTFSLKAKSETGLNVVSQGLPSVSGDYTSFSAGFPLTGLSVAMGNYVADTISVDSIKFISWHYPGNDYYREQFRELKDTLPNIISGFMKDLESGFGTPYPFRSFSILESPVNFYSFPKRNTQTRAEVQPSMVIVPEKLSTIRQAGFAKRFERQKKQMARNNQVITDRDLNVRILNNFLRSTFISGFTVTAFNIPLLNEPTRYQLGPSFYFFRNNFYSDKYPVVNSVFESHLQKLNTPGPPGGGPDRISGNISDNDMANLILRDISFRDLLARNPSPDTLRVVLTIKGDYLFNLLRMNAGITEFNEWFKKYLSENSFTRVNILKFNDDVKKRFGFEFYPLLEEWFTGKGQPGFLFTDPEASQVVVGERTRYNVTFIAGNPEPAGGLFNISFRTGGGFGGRGGGGQAIFSMTIQGGRGGGGGGRMMQISMQGRGMESADISKIVYLGPGEAKKIGIVLDNQPRAMQINTLFSKNIPGDISMTIQEIKKAPPRTAPFEGELLLEKMPLFTDPEEIIVDNEDEGFITSTVTETNRLRKLLGVKRSTGTVYQSVNLFMAPDYWQPVVLSSYYGRYARSAVYTRAGEGDKSVTWKGIIREPGYYDVYAYVGKAGDRIMIRGVGGPMGRGPGGGPGGAPGGAPGTPPAGQGGQGRTREQNPYRDMHYKVYHDDGVEEIVLDWETADPGWNRLGTYYLSPDTVKVELNNKTEGRVVIGDAIKWVIKK